MVLRPAAGLPGMLSSSEVEEVEGYEGASSGRGSASQGPIGVVLGSEPDEDERVRRAKTSAGTGDTSEAVGQVVDAAADRFGGGTGGGADGAEDAPMAAAGSPSCSKEAWRGVPQKGERSGAEMEGSGGLGSQDQVRELAAELRAGMREVFEEQHAAYLAKIDRGFLMQEEVLSRLSTVQRRLDSIPVLGVSGHDASASSRNKAAHPTLAGLMPKREEPSLRSGRNVRHSLSEARDKFTSYTSNRDSLIMPPEQTQEEEDVTGKPTGRRSNFSLRFQTFSVMPKVQTINSQDHRVQEEDEEEDDDGEDGPKEEDEDGLFRKAKKQREKKWARKHAARRIGNGGNRRAGVDTPLPAGDEGKAGFCADVTRHPIFDICSGCLIAASTIVAGTETNYMAENNGATTDSYYVVRMVFLACFAVELMLRMLGSGFVQFFISKDRGWNIFDFLMVGASVFEVGVQIANGGEGDPSSGGQGRILRILRIVRISRALRLGRVLRYARTFRQIVYSLQSSISTLMWAMIMIFLVVYCFAICFCQAWTEYISDPVAVAMPPLQVVELQLLYSSLGRSLYSLFMAMTGGRSWGELLAPLMYVSELYTLLFVIFISLTYFGVLNVVAAIFVDSAMQSQQHYKDLLIQENVMKKEVYSQHLREVFKEIDRDGSGFINGDEMEFFLADPSLNLYLESIDIFPNDARSLFRLLDRDGSGEISIEEFCEGCLRLKGEAKSFDIHCLIYANDRCQRKLDLVLDLLSRAVPE